MPTYEVERDGKKYQVEAPDPQSASESLDGHLKTAGPAQPRGAMDKLLGGTGPRFQTWPERAVRGAYDDVKNFWDASKSAPPGSRELTENMVGQGGALKTALILSPLRPRIGGSTGPLGGVPSAEEIKRAAGEGFTGTRAAKADLDSGAIAKLSSEWGAVLEARGFTPHNAPETFTILGQLKSPPAGSVTTIPNLHSVRETLGKAAQNFNNPREQAAASQAIRSLDDYLRNIPGRDVMAGDAAGAAKTLRAAIGDYAAASKSKQVTDAAWNADLRAAAANSGQNIGNTERQTFRGILGSDKKSSGFRDDELAQLERVVRGTKTGNSFRYLGNLLGGGGGMGQAVVSGFGAGGGYAAAGAEGAATGAVALPMIGAVARALANRSTNKQVGILDEMIRARSPYAQSMGHGYPVSLNPKQEVTAATIVRALLESQQPRFIAQALRGSPYQEDAVTYPIEP